MATTRKYRLTHQPQIKAYAHQYYEGNKERFRQRYNEHKEYNQKRLREYGRQNRERILKAKQQLKAEVLTHYGNGKCACVMCGYSDLRALSIDHANNNGYAHRKAFARHHGDGLYSYLKKENYPLGYQTLCMNCQFIKKWEISKLGAKLVDSGICGV